MNETIRTACFVIGAIMCLGTLLFMGFPGAIMQMFDAGDGMRSMGIVALRVISTGFVVSTLGVVFSGTFEAS